MANSCSVNQTEIVSVEDTAVETLMKSSEFLSLKHDMTYTREFINECLSRASDEDIERLQELSDLYLKDPNKYSETFKTQVETIFSAKEIRVINDKYIELIGLKKEFDYSHNISKFSAQNQEAIIGEFLSDFTSKDKINYDTITKGSSCATMLQVDYKQAEVAYYIEWGAALAAGALGGPELALLGGIVAELHYENNIIAANARFYACLAGK